MADNNAESSGLGELEVDEGLFGFDLDLEEGGDDGSGFRFQNDPARPQQRSNITERKGAIDVRCVGKDVIHGYLKSGDEPATLIVYEFQFDPRKPGRRIISGDANFLFSPRNGGGSEPEVLKIAPKGRMTLVQTRQTESITNGAEGKLGAAQFGAELGGTVKWEKTVSRETTDATTIVGTIDTKGRNYGAPNAVSWTLMENKSTKTGVPAFFRTAVLLKREDDSEFESSFDIKVSADMASRFASLFGKTPIDDPIIYDPSMPPTNKLRKYDTDNLGEIDLQELNLVTFGTATEK
ncbi:hypothetical protein CONLIGDRAFT_371755 [Coniochaeta ligniaria NRRL 30616]|uniref:Uncharacterized protein n=1 Tax=Coniochaeta ligniaria NRRL 30616 TaxID=1408157 RepID=A0A1J7JKV3_9PEZI|nr:hypothetical protein CONLIGDRAFT_371755 [Coniochaeta ligniaria NRRL 30616]